MGLFRLAADKVAYIFGVRITKRLRGKLCPFGKAA
jgi:hypothetical protein